MNRKYAKNHKRGGDCVFPAPFETPPLNRQRGTVRGSPLNPSKRGQSFGYQASFLCQVYFAKKSVGNVKHCTNLRGFQKGDRNPTSVVAGEGSQGEGESKHPLPVRVFGDFLHVEKVTLRSNQQLVTAKEPYQKRRNTRPRRAPASPNQKRKTCFRAKQKQVCCFYFTGFISSIFSIVNTVRKRE